jgi:spore maturation protein CgeB
MKILCVFGQHQYGSQEKGPGIEYDAFLPSLRRLGHVVDHFESWNRACYLDLADLNARLLDTVDTLRPDLVLAVPFTDELWIPTIRSIRRRGVYTVCWTTDDSWKYREQSRFLGRAFDCMVTTYPHIVARYHRDGTRCVHLSQWGARAESLCPPRPGRSCKYPISFIGASHGTRKTTIESLSRAGINVECFGVGWPRGSVSTADVASIMNDSVISLNFANSRGSNQIKARTFEIPGAGGFLLTDYTEGLGRYYRLNEEIATFRDMSELKSQIVYFLSNPDHRDSIALAGHRRTAAEHTYDLRLQRLLEFAQSQIKDSPEAAVTPLPPVPSAIAPPPRLLQTFRSLLVACCSVLWGRQVAVRRARRIVHELSWRLAGERTYTADGLTVRMFPRLQ